MNIEILNEANGVKGQYWVARYNDETSEFEYWDEDGKWCQGGTIYFGHKSVEDMVAILKEPYQCLKCGWVGVFGDLTTGTDYHPYGNIDYDACPGCNGQAVEPVTYAEKKQNPYEKACLEFLKGCSNTVFSKRPESCEECLKVFVDHIISLGEKK